MNSRTLQNIQHLIGGFYQISLILVGVYYGQGNEFAGTIMAIISFISCRGAVELQYQVNKAIIDEKL